MYWSVYSTPSDLQCTEAEVLRTIAAAAEEILSVQYCARHLLSATIVRTSKRDGKKDWQSTFITQKSRQFR